MLSFATLRQYQTPVQGEFAARWERGGEAVCGAGREREGRGGLLAAPAEPGEEQEGEGNDADKDDAGVLLCFLLVKALQL